METQKNIILQGEAEELFQQLKGIDKSDRVIASASHKSGQENIGEGKAESWLDTQRLLVINILHLLTSYFLDIRFLEGVRIQKNSFSELIETLEKLAGIPGIDKHILVRYRGFPTGTIIPAEFDYVIQFGTMTVDAAIAAKMFNRMGIQMTHLSGRLSKAFKVLSEHGINTLCLRLPDDESRMTSQASARLRISLDILSRYHHAFRTNTPIVFEKNGKSVSLPLIADEKGHSDPNLTLAAALNHLNPEKMNEIVQKINVRINGIHDADAPGDHHISVYNALFRIRNLNLIRPPVEINNIKWAMIDGDETPMTKEKGTVARVVTESFSHAPQEAVQILNSIYGGDYQKIDSDNFGERIRLAAGLLARIGQSADEQTALTEVIRNIQGRMKQVQDDIFDDVNVKGNAITVRTQKKETVIRAVHYKLLSVIRFYKDRAATRKKIKKIGKSGIDFDAQDYQILARDFKMPVQHVRDLLDLLRNCFDAQGHFRRKVFEDNIPVFARYEKKVFEFLWHYLKETPNRTDRVAFLNSIQLLISRIKKPENAIRILLDDFIKDPQIVNFPDRNALMLANIFVRRYNQEINVDIEITPEEVLQVRKGLNEGVTSTVARKLDAAYEKFSEKMKTIHQKLSEALNPDSDSAEMPLRYLLLLEREAHIFFSLVGGNTARAILLSAIKIYGNPQSAIYNSEASQQHMPLLLQHLKIVVRAFARIAHITDLPVLDAIKDQEKDFMAIGSGAVHREKVRRLMNWIDTSREKVIRDMVDNSKDSDEMFLQEAAG